jgi:hypothetical protein
MPAHTTPYPAATIEVIPGRRRSTRRGRAVLAALGLLALIAVVLSVPGLGPSMPAPAAVHHAAARPVPPPPVHVTVGKTVYACTVVPPRPAKRH